MLDESLAGRVEEIAGRTADLVAAGQGDPASRADLDLLARSADLLTSEFARLRGQADLTAREARHNLRNPLAAVIGYAELMLDEAPPGRQHDQLTDLHRAATDMLAAVDRLRD